MPTEKQAAWATAQVEDEDNKDDDEDSSGDDEEVDNFDDEDKESAYQSNEEVDPLDLARGIGLPDSSSSDDDEEDEQDLASLDDSPDLWATHQKDDGVPKSEATFRR